MNPGDETCSKCGSKNSARTIDKVIQGWVGIQRFDDKDNFGIDLIRNGRAIRLLEKDAFFTWTNAEEETVTDYPVDSTFGRIIGEIHMDFVPVDYLKSDFQRTSPEWYTVMKALRGESSLRPEIAKDNNEPENNSPVYKLFQGYRRVRDFGTKDMYMGYWDEATGKPARISREVEKEYYEKFKKAVPGFGIKDDEEWWKLVEAAEQRPIADVKECPRDGFQNPESAEVCENCGYIFIPKTCVNKKCGKTIPYSAEVCPHCGWSQISEGEPWRCIKCHKKNPPEETVCRNCGLPKNKEDTFNFETLLANSNRTDELSIDNLSIPLPDHETMTSINLITHYMKPHYRFERNGIRIPVVTNITSNEFHIFIDASHPAVNSFQDRPEDYIAIELAKWIQETNISKINDYNRPLWLLSSLYYTVHNSVWRDRIELDQQETVAQINNFLQDIFSELPDLLEDKAEEIYENLDEREQSMVKVELFNNNLDIKNTENYIEDGAYLKYIPESLLSKLIGKYPEHFFDGNFWSDSYERLPISDHKMLEETKKAIVQKYTICLFDLLSYKNNRNPDADLTQKVNQTLKIITKKRTKS